MRIRVVLSEPAFLACNTLVSMIYGLHTLFVCPFSVVVVLPLLLYAVIMLYVCICLQTCFLDLHMMFSMIPSIAVCCDCFVDVYFLVFLYFDFDCLLRLFHIMI